MVFPTLVPSLANLPYRQLQVRAFSPLAYIPYNLLPYDLENWRWIINIQEYMSAAQENVDEHDALALLRRRRDTFLRYCETEKHRGGIDADQLITTPRGQENVRILFARCLEEIMEAFDSDELDHYKEELIDALNFGTSILFLLPENRTDEALQELAECFNTIPDVVDFSIKMEPPILFTITALGFHNLLEKLRNRAWQNRTQQAYFTGANDMKAAVQNLWFTLAGQFDSWSDFCSFFLAKDDVLCFRIKTKY